MQDLAIKPVSAIQETPPTIRPVEIQTRDTIAQIILCGRCQAENPKSLCSRCKSMRYCSFKCQRADWASHKKICFEPVIIENESELYPIIENYFDGRSFTNTPIYFKFREDGPSPIRKFRIIHNPTGSALKADSFSVKSTRILAFDNSFSADLIKIISSRFGIPWQMPEMINQETSFELLARLSPA